MLESVDDLSKAKVLVNLKHRYPLSMRSPIKEALPWLSGYVVMVIFLEYLTDKSARWAAFNNSTELLLDLSVLLLIVGAVLVLGKFVYEFLYRKTTQYQVEENHVVVSLGVFLKRRSTIPLSLISDVSLDRGWLSLMFGLYDVFISSPAGSSSASPGRDQGGAFKISGLSSKNAVALQNFLTKAVAKAKQGEDPLNTDKNKQA